MEEYFEKFFYWEEFLNLKMDNDICYIGNVSNEPRADNDSKINELSVACSCSPILVDYDYVKDNFKFNGIDYDLKFETRKILDNLDVNIPLMLNPKIPIRLYTGLSY